MNLIRVILARLLTFIVFPFLVLLVIAASAVMATLEHARLLLDARSRFRLELDFADRADVAIRTVRTGSDGFEVRNDCAEEGGHLCLCA